MGSRGPIARPKRLQALIGARPYRVRSAPADVAMGNMVLPADVTPDEAALIEQTFSEVGNRHLRTADLPALARWARLSIFWREASGTRSAAERGSTAAGRALREVLSIAAALAVLEKELGLSSASRSRVLSTLAARDPVASTATLPMFPMKPTKATKPKPRDADPQPDRNVPQVDWASLPPDCPVAWGRPERWRSH